MVAPDEEKLLKSIERVTRQKIPDGDLMGFDASQVEAEKPEVRERQQNNGRGGRNQQARGEGGKDANGGRKDKGKDKGKAKQQAADKPADKEKSGDKQQQQRKQRDKKPRQQQQQASNSNVPKVPVDRDPEEFLDDDIDNFGNRADYVSPYQGKNQGRNRRPGGNAGQGQGQGNGQRSNAGGQGRNSGQPRSGGEKRPARANNGGGARRDGGGRGRPARDDAARQEPAVRNPRQPEKQPVIIRKESKLDRYPTPEQLDDLPSRPRGERPALLTRKG